MPNINDFKAKLRGGGARANQFRVTMPFPGYASVGGETETMSFLRRSLVQKIYPLLRTQFKHLLPPGQAQFKLRVADGRF